MKQKVVIEGGLTPWATVTVEAECVGGFLIINPDWPKGDLPYRQKCPYWRGPGECEEEECETR